MSVSVIPLLASTLGQIFQPLFEAMAWLLAFFYALVPNYAVAIALLTIVVMAVTAPLTVKSTRSMLEMQRIYPEVKKLQQRYKGDRQQLNEELMKLYREHGINPAGGCLPTLIQFPIFIILYDLIRGLTNVRHVHHLVVPAPRYIDHHTRLYHDLVHASGRMVAFGVDLAKRALDHHASAAAAIPYWVLIALAIVLQYVQIRQLNTRNPQAAQANPQVQQMQKILPIVFAVIYLNISAGVNVYFVVSSVCRIGIQEAIFRTGLARPRVGAGRRSWLDRLYAAQQRALGAPEAASGARERGSADGKLGTERGSMPLGGDGERKVAGAVGERASSSSRKPHPRSRSKRVRRSR
jgi:YidC/Oxa1 family membrane protein insertase